MSGALLREFSEICEAIKSTSSKLEKIDILSNYLIRLDPSSLQIVCRFLSGHIFPRWREERLQVGYSTLTELILEISGAPESEMNSAFLKHGDLGDVAEEIFSKRILMPLLQKSLELTEVYRSMGKMASISGKGSAQDKRSLMKGLLLDCTPLEAKYLVKVLLGELRIGLVEGLVEEGVAKAFDYSLREVRAANLVLADIGATALLASQKKLSESSLELGHPTNFMLADTMATAPEIFDYLGGGVYAEYKYDGIRAQAHKSKEVVKIFSRRLEDVSGSFPEVVSELKALGHSVILDGEILPFKDGRPLSFQMLQHRLRRKNQDTKIIQDVPVNYFVYDLLYLDGSVTLGRPLSERRSTLESLGMKGVVQLSHLTITNTAEEIQEAFEKSKELGYEGLVVKNPSSPYTPGRHGRHWVKLKKELDTLDVVIVAAEHGHGKRAGLLSDYTFAVRDGGELKVIGKAYSGLTDEEILEMTERLKKIIVRDMGFRLLIQPSIVLEVAFDNIQRSGRHDSGFALRFPRIKRIRHDKSPEDIDTLDRVRQIYDRQHAKA